MKANLCAMIVPILLMGLARPVKSQDIGIRVYNECDISTGPRDGSGTDNATALRYQGVDYQDGTHGVQVTISAASSTVAVFPAVNVILTPKTDYTLELYGDAYAGTGGSLTATITGGGVTSTFPVNWVGAYKGATRTRATLSLEGDDTAWVFVERSGKTVAFQLVSPLQDVTSFDVRPEDNNTEARFTYGIDGDNLSIDLSVGKKLYFGSSRLNLAGSRERVMPIGDYTLTLTGFPAHPAAVMATDAGVLFTIDPLEWSLSTAGSTPIVNVLPYRSQSAADGSVKAFYALVIHWRGRTVVFNIAM